MNNPFITLHNERKAFSINVNYIISYFPPDNTTTGCWITTVGSETRGDTYVDESYDEVQMEILKKVVNSRSSLSMIPD